MQSMAPAMMEEQTWENELDTDDYKQTVRLAKGLAAHNVKQLPEDYQLGEHDVICGRGRKCFQHSGNQRFRKLVADMLPKYSESPSKLDKTFIICDVVNRVRENSPNGGFVKKDPMSGRYFEVGDFLAREKTSQAFRDALHDQYKSSNAAKKKRRLQDQGMQLQRQSSAPLLNTGNMHEYHGDVVSSNNFESYVVDNTNFLLVEQPERQAKMQKRFSAPMINVSYMDKGEGDGNFAGVPSAHNFMLNDYSANVFKFQRNDQAQQGLQAMQQNMGLPTGDFESMPQTMSLPSGEFESRNFVPLSSFKPSKRHSFAGQFGHESMRCIIDEARQTTAAASSSDWYNGSCPNLSAMDAPAAAQQPAPMLPQCEEPDDASIITFPPKNMFGERHHSEPRLTSHSLNQLEGSCAPSTMERINTMPSLSQSSTSQVNNNSFDIFDSRPKTPVNTGPANEDNIELSPIGDGTTCGLFDIFKDFTADGCDKDSDDLFAPLPF